MSTVIKLGIIPGDGIGPEVIAEAEKVLDLVAKNSAIDLEKTHFRLGAERYRATGETLTDKDLADLAEQDVLLLGAVGGVPGDPDLKGANIERGLLLKLRFAFEHYVNLRPSRIYPGAPSPLSDAGDVDFVVVREGTEGPYVGNGGSMRVGTPHEVTTETSLTTAFGVERVARYAFDLARDRRKKLTVVHKTNVLVHAGAVWQRIIAELSEQYRDVAVEYMHVDAATIHMVNSPERFDVIVTDNLFGDILTDLAAAVTGGIGLAASGNINPNRTFPSMFEPVHGSAPDIAGTGQADPTAAILSAGMLLDHMGHLSLGEQIRSAVRVDLADRGAQNRSTAAIGENIRARIG